MKKFKLLLAICVLTILFSFKTETAKNTFKTGSYGLCSCNKSKDNAIIIELKINADSTFQYIDYSNPTKKINTSGKWEFKNKSLILKDYVSVNPIHNNWKMDDNGKCIKSRKGLTYYRICNTEECK